MNNEIKTISPFKNFCITVGALPTSYLESMSYYEMLCWLCKYLENTINPAINQNAEALKELQEYVTNYFDNLDVTEEINNKLDEMAEDGTLAHIINVEMIGNLSNLTTEDKTDLVSAINEVNNNFNFTNFITLSTPTSTEYCEKTSGNFSLIANSDYSVFKLYGNCRLHLTDSTDQIINIKFDSDLRPSEDYYINPFGIVYNEQDALGGGQVRGMAYCWIRTTGVIEIGFYGKSTFGENPWICALPCIYFNKNFGDTPNN